MAQTRLTGVVDWFNTARHYGVIVDSQGAEHFVHFSNVRGDQDLTPGGQVTFFSRTRTRGTGGTEAYDVEVVKPPVRRLMSGGTSPRDVQEPLSGDSRPVHATDASTQRVAQEALRLKIARRRGGTPQPVEEFPPATQVHHEHWGYGTVELASAETISFRPDVYPHRVIDVPRSEVRLATSGIEGPVGNLTSPSQHPRSGSAPANPPSLNQFLGRLRGDVQAVLEEEHIEGVRVYHREEEQGPVLLPVPLEIDPLVSALFKTAEGITDFYSHQIETRNHLLANKHIVITTPTASGKTESYNPTILETLLRDPQATALYLFPLVALGEDQATRLRRLNAALPVERRLRIGIYNNSLDPDEKNETLRADNRILVTTPDSLHYIFLPKPYPNWRRFYRNLRYVVLDEAHICRGVLGANVSNIVRRLLIRCRREGNPQFPQVIVASATILNPQALAHQLTGLPEDQFAVVDRNGAPQPIRHYLSTREDVCDLSDLCADLLELQTVDARTAMKRPVRTIVFLRSIREAKNSAERLRHYLRSHRKWDLVDRVADYYAEKADKKDILVRLREGSIGCVFTTTALMAGIDIGGLDVSIVKNFPGLVMDVRQMFGRAGRAGEGAAVFVANRTDPFDEFYFERADLLFSGEIEEVVANPENPYLLAAHLKCAARNDAHYKCEGPLPGQWTHLFGEMGQDLLDLMVTRGQLVISRGRYELASRELSDEALLKNLRSIETEEYTLVTSTPTGWRELERKRESNAYRDAHPGATLRCDEVTYKVTSLDRENRRITCQPQPDADVRTRGIQTVAIDPKGDLTEKVLGSAGLQLGSGEVTITTQVCEYVMYRLSTVMRCRSRKCRHETSNLDARSCPRCGGAVRVRRVEKSVGKFPVITDEPLITTLETRASWLKLAPAFRERFEREVWPRWMSVRPDSSDAEPVISPTFEDAIHSLLHAVLKAFPERIRCDREEIDGVHLLDGSGTICQVYVYDTHPGGLGLVDEFYDEPCPFLENALALIERCNCDEDEGCPVCLSHFGCHVFNANLSKFAGRYLLRAVLSLPTEGVMNDLRDYVHKVVPPSQVVHGVRTREAAFMRGVSRPAGLVARG